MDKEFAKYVARVAFRASADMGDLIPLIKEHCSHDEYERLSLAIATASATIGLEILNLIFAEFPEIRQEFDKNVKDYGKVL